MTSRIFLDASALFAAAYSPTGAARELLRLGLEGSKAPEGVAIIRTSLAALPSEVLPASQPNEIEAVRPLVVAKDAPILAGALACGADYLATFDRQHLIGIDVTSLSTNLVIATPGDILNRIRF